MAFDALADPVRREILAVLAARKECSAGELSRAVQRVGRTAVSSHLRILRMAGLVVERRSGRFRYYSIDGTGPAQDVIKLLQELFQGSLEAAKAVAESTTSAAPGALSDTALDDPAMAVLAAPRTTNHHEAHPEPVAVDPARA